MRKWKIFRNSVYFSQILVIYLNQISAHYNCFIAPNLANWFFFFPDLLNFSTGNSGKNQKPEIFVLKIRTFWHQNELSTTLYSWVILCIEFQKDRQKKKKIIFEYKKNKNKNIFQALFFCLSFSGFRYRKQLKNRKS